MGEGEAPLKVYVVDNGGQWTHREWRVLKYLGADTKMIPNDTSWDDIAAMDLDGLLLSGGAPRVGVEGTLGTCGDILDHAQMPILGICAGHQFMARHFGGDAAPGGSEFGATQIEILPHDDPDLMKEVPSPTQVFESHHDEVSKVPGDFEVLAKSELCAIQAMRHKTRPLYGFQFHPEVEGSEHGVKMFENFLDICRARRADTAQATNSA